MVTVRLGDWIETLPGPRNFAARPLAFGGPWMDHYLRVNGFYGAPCPPGDLIGDLSAGPVDFGISSGNLAFAAADCSGSDAAAGNLPCRRRPRRVGPTRAN